ncbi:MAG: site-2 protease family protein [Myxococcota bacterium]|nr:site-2 protease family protein [Myxococcota bacterium]
MDSRRSAKPAGSGRLTRSGLALFRIAGIEIRLDYSWFLIFWLVLMSLAMGYLPGAHPGHAPAAYWAAGLAATLLFFLSLLAHELSHALVALRAGIQVPAITLFLFGGVSHMSEEPRRPGTELRVAIAGPLMSFALALGFWGAKALLGHDAPTLVAAVLGYLAWVNTALGVFNLLPGFPLDGGRVLRALLWRRTGSLERATRAAADAGRGLSVGIMILGGLQIFAGALLGGLWLIFIGLFLRTMAGASYQNLVLLRTLQDVTVADVAVPDPVVVEAGLSIQALVNDYILPLGYRGFPVMHEGRVQGVIDVTRLRKLPREAWPTTSVRECMTPLSPQLVVTPELPLSDALKQLTRSDSGRLLVVRDDALVGMLTKSGLLRFIELRRVLEEV